MSPRKVLILTGGYISPKDKSLVQILKKQFLQSKYATHSWLETTVKMNMAEPVVLSKWFLKKSSFGLSKKISKPVKNYLTSYENLSSPELTEVSLMTLLESESIEYEGLEFEALFSNSKLAEKRLNECSVVFVSTTFLRDESELQPIIDRVKKANNKIVVGGALTGIIHGRWQGHPEIDIFAVGYGEFLVPSIADWIKSDFQKLVPPENGRIRKVDRSQILYSGVPTSLSLDELPLPDWRLAEKYHGKSFRMIHYESVRGCPYRCAFCNYPYLFDDTKFRMKSAQKMADDWQFYTENLGAEYITCLDSLFTMPRRRLIEFCNELVSRKIRVKWICYARADDLSDEETVRLLKLAGCIQVQIGIESGDQGQLTNMNKKVRIEQNAKALENCRKVGLTTVASFVVGFPGETKETLKRTFEFMKSSPPDFYFLCTFSTRVPGVPILSPKNAEKFGLITDTTSKTVSPYWRHDTMSCDRVGPLLRELNQKIVDQKVSLDATIFYQNIHRFDPGLRDELLDFQKEALQASLLVRKTFKFGHKWVDRKLKNSVAKFFLSYEKNAFVRKEPLKLSPLESTSTNENQLHP